MSGRLDALRVRPCADCAAEQKFVDLIEAYQIVGNWQERLYDSHEYSLPAIPGAGGESKYR